MARLDTYTLRRSSHDLYARGLVGPVFYLMAYLLLLAVSDYVQRWSWLVMAPTAVFGLLWWLRYRHKAPAADATPEAFQKWNRGHWLLIHLGSVAWSAVPSVVGWLEHKPNSAILIAALSTMAFCTAVSQSFAMHPAQARLSILILMGPAVAVFVLPGLELRSIGITLFFYSLYLLANLRRSATEYAHQLDTEVELIRSREEVALLSLTDPLTGLPNRRHYELAWEQTASAAQRQQASLALLVLDLDHFKRVNDRHGHLGGDAGLRHFAQVLRQHFRREHDFIARIGGEEFIVILPGTSAEGAAAMAEQLRSTLAASPCRFGAEEIPQTVSVGVATAEADPAATFQRADAACYAAKQSGRDRVVCWTAELRPRAHGAGAAVAP